MVIFIGLPRRIICTRSSFRTRHVQQCSFQARDPIHEVSSVTFAPRSAIREHNKPERPRRATKVVEVVLGLFHRELQSERANRKSIRFVHRLPIPAPARFGGIPSCSEFTIAPHLETLHCTES
ncbi:hypothetical protein Mp_1g01220 [Marchantia polymorpha subsp. ruderalis]|uniref:Uncharacterized protein n=2 Tax=Marchantia polymorpha TaxID=3197 RepID=A0AAF6AK90_MARPO|nr:hypothetical protein MARPO_0029s0124 [Marchantia polymorpha]BBM96860.1 hypothetical protein Mp_1g01220 [Marchantia polymorpha subsp. ruderalis]|eukprot:PTQ42623.1 hypothetical protein MARPO_0029s0124 [Marchantia polymorpha]